VRWATAAVAGGALLATGALTVGVAQAHPATAGSTAENATGSSGSTSGTDQQSPDRPSPPGGVGAGRGSGSHASSGGS
jgi:hypothetical protein